MRKLLIIIICLFIVFALSKEVLSYSGVIHRDFFTQCFSVDSRDNLYITHGDIIEVYRDNQILRTLNPHTRRAYDIIIENDELIVEYASGNVKVYDLDGTYIRDENKSTITLSKDVFTRGVRDFNGKTYRINGYFGFKPYVITCDDVIVYRQPTIDYIYNGLPFHLFFVLCFFSALIVVPWIILDKNNGFYKMFH